jgi:hypothetical protein
MIGMNEQTITIDVEEAQVQFLSLLNAVEAGE